MKRLLVLLITGVAATSACSSSDDGSPPSSTPQDTTTTLSIPVTTVGDDPATSSPVTEPPPTTSAGPNPWPGTIVTERLIDAEQGVLAYYSSGEDTGYYAGYQGCVDDLGDNCTYQISLVEDDRDVRVAYQGPWRGWAWLLERRDEVDGAEQFIIVDAVPFDVDNGLVAHLVACEPGQLVAQLDFEESGPTASAVWAITADGFIGLDASDPDCPALETRDVSADGAGLLFAYGGYFAAPTPEDRDRVIDLTGAMPGYADWWSTGGGHVGESARGEWWLSTQRSRPVGQTSSTSFVWLETSLGWEEDGHALFRVQAALEIVGLAEAEFVSYYLCLRPVGENFESVVAVVRNEPTGPVGVRAWTFSLDPPTFAEATAEGLVCRYEGD